MSPQKAEEAQEDLVSVGMTLPVHKQAASLIARKKKKKKTLSLFKGENDLYMTSRSLQAVCVLLVFCLA
jgi:hypothetical protein